MKPKNPCRDSLPITAPSRHSEWRCGGALVAVSALGFGISTIHLYTLGVFMTPLQAALGWSRTALTLGLTIVSVVSVVLAPFAGLLIDRWGPRKLALPGIVLYCGAFALLGLTTWSTWSWWLTWCLLALGSVSLKATVWTAAVSSRFTKARGLALALTLCGTGLCSAIAPLGTSLLLSALGWRGSYVMIGVVCAVVALPLLTLFFFDATEDQLRRGRSPAAGPAPKTGLSAREGMVSGRFARLALGALLMQIAITSLTVHFVPTVQALGLSPRQAAAIASLIGLSSIGGRLASGILIDRADPRLVTTISFFIPALACGILLLGDGSSSAAAAVAVALGVSLGAEIHGISYLSAGYFGLRSYGVMFGTIAGLMSFGAGVGPLFASVLFDYTGSYMLGVTLVGPMFLVAGALIYSCGSLPQRESIVR
jgi:MFS family permease